MQKLINSNSPMMQFVVSGNGVMALSKSIVTWPYYKIAVSVASRCDTLRVGRLKSHFCKVNATYLYS